MRRMAAAWLPVAGCGSPLADAVLLAVATAVPANAIVVANVSAVNSRIRRRNRTPWGARWARAPRMAVAKICFSLDRARLQVRATIAWRSRFQDAADGGCHWGDIRSAHAGAGWTVCAYRARHLGMSWEPR